MEKKENMHSLTFKLFFCTRVSLLFDYLIKSYIPNKVMFKIVWYMLFFKIFFIWKYIKIIYLFLKFIFDNISKNIRKYYFKINSWKEKNGERREYAFLNF
jgi:hypothetical protein